MPTKSTVRKAKRDLAQGKKPSTAAGEFVREEIKHVRQGKHGARSAEQAIAIGLSKARRAGVPLKPQKAGRPSTRTRPEARPVSRVALAKHARKAAAKRSAAERSRAAKAAASTRRGNKSKSRTTTGRKRATWARRRNQ